MNGESDSRQVTVEIPAGELVGQCENCGLVREHDLETGYPHGSTCQHCGEEVEKTKAVTETKEVSNSVVA
jgi:hypothetical protein